MKQFQILRKLQLVLILAFGSVPLPLMLFSAHGQPLLPVVWVYPAAYAIAAALSLVLPGKWRLVYGILAAAACVGFAVMIPTGLLRLVSAIPAVGYAALLLWSLKIGGWGRDDELPGYLYGTLFALQLTGQVSLLMNSTTGNGSMVPYGPGLKAAFLAFVLLSLLSMNRKGLHEAAEKRQRISGQMFRKNLLLTLSLFGIALAVALAPSAYGMVKQLILWIAWLVLQILMLVSRPQSGSTAEGGGGAGSMPMGDASAPGALALFLEKIVTFAAVILIVVLAAVLFYRIGRGVVRILRLLWKRLERYAEHVAVDYVDEITDTRDDPYGERIARRSAVRHVSAKEQRNMSPTEKIRYRYLRLLVKHPQWAKGSTPREKLPADLAMLYEKARYSDHPVTEADADRFSSGTKTI